MELVPWLMPGLEATSSQFRGALPLGYWQMPLTEEAQDLSTIVSPSRLYASCDIFPIEDGKDIAGNISGEEVDSLGRPLKHLGESQEEMVDDHGRILGESKGRCFNVAVHEYRHFVRRSGDEVAWLDLFW